ncbi:MAG TPA: hypothetical protein VHT28_05975, partial [Silvibacterium sp.]|nr:hypothetical protein [Silvibacterium sp.]
MTMKWLGTAAAQAENYLPKREYCRTTKIAKVICMIVGCLTMLLSSAPAFGREINILLIHGRLHNSKERYGHFRTDQAG